MQTPLIHITLVVGESPDARAEIVRRLLRERGTTASTDITAAADWPFRRHVAELLPAGASDLRVRDLHEMFPAGQSGSTRLVLTQSAYQVQRWLDWLAAAGRPVRVIADADRDALRRGAPEAFAGRGPWREAEVIDAGTGTTSADAASAPVAGDDAGRPPLIRAFQTGDPEERLALCRRAAEARPDDAAVHLGLGSASMEVQDLPAAESAIARALELAPDWEAVHFEQGKLWLRGDDMERAARAFAEAGRLMPTFSAAFSNLGATLGELDRPVEATAAFEQALRYDPRGYPILNNLGVVRRELGRLAESADAFRRVIALAPDFVFGHYNLGHTLFLQGRYQAALSAYVEGQRRDPERNARQACRLAVVRLAAGDAEGALRDLRQHLPRVPREQKREILAEAQEILWALLTDQPALAGWRQVADVVKAELAALG